MGRWVRVAAAVAVVVGLAALAVVERSAVTAVLHALRAPSPPWLVAAIVAEAASMGFYARMQRRLLRGAGTTVPLRRAVGLAYTAHSMSITLPGGPLVSTVYNYRRMRGFGADPTVAAWCTAASGVLSTLGLVALTAATGLAAAVDGDDDGPAVLGVLTAAVLVVAGVLLRRYGRLRAPLLATGSALRNRLPARLQRGFDAGTDWAARLLRVRIPAQDLAVASAQSVLNWAADAGCLALCCTALGVHVRPIPLVVTYIAGMSASSVPIVPGGLGTVDATLAYGLVQAGAKASPALAVVVLYRLISFALLGAIGWLLWLVGRNGRALHAEPEPPG